MIKIKGYIFSRPFNGERAPQHIQNLVIRDFCIQKKVDLILSSVEYAMNNSWMILKQIIKNLDKFDGIIFYSIYQLPDEESSRIFLYKNLLQKNKKIFFALEKKVIFLKDEFENLEITIKIIKTLNKDEKVSDLLKKYA
jgi:sporadic carbohydrate cluster protein (TIGR04323 family)